MNFLRCFKVTGRAFNRSEGSTSLNEDFYSRLSLLKITHPTFLLHIKMLPLLFLVFFIYISDRTSTLKTFKAVKHNYFGSVYSKLLSYT